MPTIRIELPLHLRRLANLPGHEALLDIATPVTLNSVLDTLEAHYPMLRGTIRDHVTHQHRAFLRFFVSEEDWTHLPPDTPLPEAITTGREPLLILGAIAGG
jgi:molybdopterin synthase sulfur carrier subunit